MASQYREPIAIVGSGCRFPGSASSPSRLWRLLHHPVDILSKIPVERFNTTGVYHPNGMHHGSTNVCESYLLDEDHRVFDARFFNIKPVEAQSMDPQQRLLLETVYEALENAGLTMESLKGSDTAVYVGLMANEYGDLLSRDIDHLPTYFATATAASILSNRVSYFFDWHGPSITLDTACSSSLVAVHQAVQTLRNGECKVAVTAGANLILGPKPYISENKLNMLSPDSRSRMWDEKANGYARGEGIAALVLKTLSQALTDGDDIECLIRETGINQDGRTKGITMPSNIAQEMLIRDTYRRAGLDSRNPMDRPQFFEAHGTGTPAGDPQEAAAIYTAFFGPVPQASDSVVDDILHVGSIKTVVGHTEGTAGIAGIMKASLAMRHGVIPPNMLFDKLNPEVAPFYGNIQIPTSPVTWPARPQQTSRRASVNSFGFGGTNAHAILEYPTDLNSHTSRGQAFLPFILSAGSESSLRSLVRKYADYLEHNEAVSLRDLAFTLNFKRTMFPYRANFASTTTGDLVQKMHTFLEKNGSISTTALPKSQGILGIFTGQGAQWPTMARELVLQSKLARSIAERLERTLSSLPEGNRPMWSLMDELLADASNSRVQEAALSQPLCTVVQIILVDLLRAAGIQFAAVVGHSSGEIGAAYAAGFISAENALLIAYYRGVHSSRAGSASGSLGAMLAVGTSLEDATELCELEDMAGRISVAACNSSSSITLSGDIDAIEEALVTFQDEKKFVRKLKVDTAYHSHHMQPCTIPYIRSLEASNIKILPSAGTMCAWFSSVTGGLVAPDNAALQSTYWSENMAQPVLFAQALRAALEQTSDLGVAMELGPHPALRGPALQTIQEVTKTSMPYSGILERGKNDVEAIMNTLAFASSNINPDHLKLADFDAAMSDFAPAKLLKDVPNYAWDHDRIYWNESRLSRASRTLDIPIHELLGRRSPTQGLHQLQWRNILSAKEIPWLDGHKLQGQIVFPAAGYASMAIEAAMTLAGTRPIRLVELQDFVISKAMVFEEDETSAEVFCKLDVIEGQDSGNTLRARFSLEGTTSQNSDDLVTYSSSTVLLHFGEVATDVLPPRGPDLVDSVDVDPESFYKYLATLGYHYSGPFRALQGMKRTTDTGSALIQQLSILNEGSSLLIHPATLDCAIQAAILAFCWPEDNRLWTLHVPTRITRLRLNPSVMASNAAQHAALPIDSMVGSAKSGGVSGDITMYGAGHDAAIMQIEGLEIVPFTASSAELDAKLFFDMRWDVAGPEGSLISRGVRATAKDRELGASLERVSYLYLKFVCQELTAEDWSKAEPHFRQMREFANDVVTRVENGTAPGCDAMWKYDTLDQVAVEVRKWPGNIDLRLLTAVGENLAAAIRGQTMILEHMLKDNVLNDFYCKGLGLDVYTHFLSNAVQQISHRYCNMDILEIGAGTGGVTKTIIRELGGAFRSYTYTDISSGFFETAQEVFRDYRDRMVFRTLDVEKDPVTQNFSEGSFDLIVCSLVLHATENLGVTLSNVRRLLKPGGYLAMLEITDMDSFRTGFAMSALPGWWLGHKDGRALNPCVSADRWDSELRKTGFSGIKAITDDLDALVWPFSVIVAQATNDQVQLLENPLAVSPRQQDKDLLLIGGINHNTVVLSEQLQSKLRPWFRNISRIDTVAHFNSTSHAKAGTVLCFSDLDTPIFKDLTQPGLDGLRNMFEHSRNVLWVTQGAHGTDPYATMMNGFSRTLVREMPHLRIQCFDLDSTDHIDPELVAQIMLKLELSEEWEKDDSNHKALWSLEPEAAINKGVVIIPRMFATKELNDRYNSTRRHITMEVDLNDHVVSLSKKNSGHTRLEASQKIESTAVSGASILISVSYSSIMSFRVSSDSRLFLVAGVSSNTNEHVVALSTVLASQVAVPTSWAITCSESPEKKASLIAILGLALVAGYLVQQTPQNSVLLIQEPPPALADQLAMLASYRNVEFAYLTCNPNDKRQNAIFVHPNAPSRSIQSAMPSGVAIFVDFTKDTTFVENPLIQFLPASCAILNVSELFDTGAFDRTQEIDVTAAALRYASSCIKDINMTDPLVVPVNDIQNINVDSRRLDRILSWDTSRTIPVDIQPVDIKPLFRPDRTYLLFGLTGQIGRSLALWMAGLGAKYIVLTSRHPVVDEQWLEKVRQRGAEVRIVANDITNKVAVQKLVEDVRKTMPQIGGVTNAAMVLQDTAVAEMTLETMNKVLRPKVDGTLILDELFQDDSLDFFIVFSSIAWVYGQHGQSNYTAANAFLNGLVRRRRNRGLPGSVMAIGAVLGIGYIAREVDKTTYQRIQQNGYRLMSERDLHQLFAEAVIASARGIEGRPKAYEIITGIREMKEGEERTLTNPIFQHVIVRQRSGISSAEQAVSKVPLKTQLLGASTPQDAYTSIKGAFLEKLQSILQLDSLPGLKHGPDELGVDSLIAVEIRSWFLKEVGVDMPVLKILGGATVATMIDFAAENLPQDLTPNIQGSSVASLMTDGSTRNQSSAASVFSQDSKAAADPSTDISTPDPRSTTQSTKPGTPRVAPMSHGQARFWFLRTLLEDATAFNISFAVKLRGELNLERLSTAVKSVLHRHAALRTRFYDAEDGSPMQEVLDSPVFELSTRNITSLDALATEFNRLKTHEYDLANGDLMQLVLLKQDDSTYYLLVGYHHINMDAASLQVLLSDIDTVYRGRALVPEVLQYPTFATRQRHAARIGEWDADLAYWRTEFPDFPAPLPFLPFSEANTRHVQTHYSHCKASRKVSAKVAAQIKSVSSKLKVSPYHIHMTIFKTLLARYLDIDDIAIGMADANRTEMDQLAAIGLYLNLLPLRFAHTGEQSFADAAKEAQSKIRKALAHSRVPFDVLLEQLEPERSVNYSPIFQAFIDYKPPSTEKTRIFDCDVVRQDYEVGQTAYDITLSITDEPDGAAEIIFQLQESLYSVADAETLLETYMWFLDQFSLQPKATVNAFPLLNPSAAEEVSRIGEGPLFTSDWAGPISHRIQQMVDFHGDLPAVVVSGTKYSYRALNSKVNTLVARMREIKIAEGSIVAIYQEPGIEWLSSVLAVLRLGAVYLPLDIRTPLPRLTTMVKEAQPIAILVHTPTFRLSQTLSSHTLSLVDISSLVKKRSDKTTPNIGTSKSRAALLFTSGTTGDPKGVFLLNEALSNSIETLSRSCEVGVGSVVLQQTAVSFDMSLCQTFMALTTGACLVIATSEERADPAAMVDLMISAGVSITFATPSEYQWWIHSCGPERFEMIRLQVAITGGEKIKQSLLDAFKSLSGPRFLHIDFYGPTEATIFSNFGAIDYTERHARIPVGRTAPNTAVYVVDEEHRLLPAGMAGEVLIGGIGVNGGYLRDELSKERFLPNPFASTEFRSNQWTKMYRTGDRGRMLRDGNLVIEGRISGDTQVKLRGVRMELQDIERNLTQASNGVVLEAAVSIRGDPPFLAAYVVFAKSRAPSNAEEYLQELVGKCSLPVYMRPALILPLDRMPVNQNFKLDRAALAQLPLPSISSSENADNNLTELERRLKDTWHTVLPKNARNTQIINAASDFFHVGGNSMLMARLQKEIVQVFYVKVSLIQLFEKSTLGAMTSLVGSQIHGDEPAVAINWDAETAVRSEDLPTVYATQNVRDPEPKTIILTGSTGFLGRNIVQKLIEDPNIDKIHCLAVRRDESKDSRMQKLPAKVQVHYGDLSKQHFGLKDSVLESILSHSDVVIHNAADVSFMKSYHSLRLINVSATKTLALLAQAHRIPFHYISTSGVAHLSGLNEFAEVSAAAYPPPTDGSDGYVASKWASEVYLEKLNAATGLPIWIHRPSSIMGDDHAPTDLMGSLFTYGLKLRAVPILRGLDNINSAGGYADLIDVNKVASGILKHVRANKATESGLRFIHHSGEMVIPMQALVGDGGDEWEQGLGLQSVPIDEWVSRAKEMGLHELVAELLTSAEEGLRQRSESVANFMLYPRLLQGGGEAK